jgi:hypothetical protein
MINNNKDSPTENCRKFIEGAIEIILLILGHQTRHHVRHTYQREADQNIGASLKQGKSSACNMCAKCPTLCFTYAFGRNGRQCWSSDRASAIRDKESELELIYKHLLERESSPNIKFIFAL